jgi:hypothetical protein
MTRQFPKISAVAKHRNLAPAGKHSRLLFVAHMKLDERGEMRPRHTKADGQSLLIGPYVYAWDAPAKRLWLFTRMQTLMAAASERAVSPVRPVRSPTACGCAPCVSPQSNRRPRVPMVRQKCRVSGNSGPHLGASHLLPSCCHVSHPGK